MIFGTYASHFRLIIDVSFWTGRTGMGCMIVKLGMRTNSTIFSIEIGIFKWTIFAYSFINVIDLL